jgi:hypothetical protein
MSKDETAIVKKLPKKERLLAKRLARSEMLKVNTQMKVTLECPECHVQQIMTLNDYFHNINYGSVFPKRMKCAMCKDHPELMFYKVNMKQVAAAGLNWEREQQGISEEDMLGKLETYDKVKGIVSPKSVDPDKVLLE